MQDIRVELGDEAPQRLLTASARAPLGGRGRR
jgi:hypothetical protein